jgi:zinc transport system permease protein
LDIFLEYFFQRALLGGFLIGLLAPLMGIFLVLRRLSMIGDTLAHVSIAGVALGFLIEVYPLALGILFAVGGALIIEKLRKAYKGYAELSIAIMLSGGVALASILFTLGKGFNMNVMSYLFGSIYTLDRTDLQLITGVTVIVLLFIFLNFKELFLVTLDEDTAKVNGLPLGWINIMMTVLTAVVISAAIKIVGALLVSALLTIPVASSLLLGKGFKTTLIFAIIFSELAVMSGLIAAGLWNLAPGGTIVMLLIGILLFLLAGKRLIRF